MTPVLVLGALNLDLCGMPAQALRLHDSNPGRVTLSPGGVGHNIALGLAGCGIAVELATVLGDDAAATLLAHCCAQAGIGLRHAARMAGASSTYLCLMDEAGDMLAAVNDMLLLDAYTPALAAQAMRAAGDVPLIVLDANLPRESIEAVAESAKAPLLLDPVSGFKFGRARRVIGRFAAIKPNWLEAAQMSGAATPREAAAWFLHAGVRQVFISLGGEGVYYADGAGQGQLAAPAMRVASASGAGDAMTSGIARGMLQGVAARDCAALGMEASTNHLLQQGGILL